MYKLLNKIKEPAKPQAPGDDSDENYFMVKDFVTVPE